MEGFKKREEIRRLYLEHLWGWWVVLHAEHGGQSEPPLWVEPILVTVPCVTNLRRGFARFGPDMTSDSPVRKKLEQLFNTTKKKRL